MSDPELARKLIRMARKDVKAMCALTSPEVYEPETFGFHAQQAVEKSLKAWLALRDVPYPPTHSLRYLIDLLKQDGCDVSNLWPFLDLGPFAVQFRYDAYDAFDQELDVAGIKSQIVAFVYEVESMLPDGPSEVTGV